MAYFDGSGYLNLGVNTTKAMSQPFTVAFKFAADEHFDNTGIIGSAGSSHSFRQCYMGARDNPFLQITLYSNNYGRLESSPVSTGQIYSAIIVVKDKKEYFYLNGVLDKQASFTFTGFQMFSKGMVLGATVTSTLASYFKGYISDVRIYERAITDDEITKLANN